MSKGRQQIIAALVAVAFVSNTMGFAPAACTATATIPRHNYAAMTHLQMGLYDTPLPPRPPKREDPKDKKPVEEDDEDDDEDSVITERLFTIGKDGKEIRGLLPRLRRRLESGVACYFEPTDRLVQNLVGKTSCRPEDACWALEACEGDITEAWMRISTARRMMLNKSRNSLLLEEDDDYDQDDYDMEVLDEYQQRKKDLQAESKKRNRDEYFTPSKPDAQWLPIKNPNPVDDEPWFTG